jgi:hypothetical protein
MHKKIVHIPYHNHTANINLVKGYQALSMEVECEY